MNLFEELEKRTVKCREHNVISITGGGGKTSLMTEFGYYLRNRGLSVLLTTTTKIASPKNHDYRTDFIYDNESVLGYQPEKGRSVLYAEHSFDVKKWSSPREEVLSVLVSRFDAVLIEADGSRGLPLKYHTERDPVIIPQTDSVIGVTGLWGIGQRAYETVFGDGSDALVDRSYIESYLRNPEGITKGMRQDSYNAVLFNGMDLDAEYYRSFIKELGNSPLYEIIPASVKEGRIYV